MLADKTPECTSPLAPREPTFSTSGRGDGKGKVETPSTLLGKSYHRETVQGGPDSALAEFSAVLPVISTKELESHGQSWEGQDQSAPEPRRPWDVELNPALISGLGYSLPVPPFLRRSLIFI